MKKKVLLMGKSGSGKTSMRSVIFASLVPSLTSRLGATIDVEQNHVKFLGSLFLNLWDAGGQESFMQSYLSAQKATVFANVAVLIYVFDVESRETDKETAYYRDCLDALAKHSPESGVFALVHKMDLIAESERQETFLKRRKEIIEASGNWKMRAFGTSIWDESLYKAWSRIVHTLIPNSAALSKHLTTLSRACGAVEVILFERATFLLIARSDDNSDPSDDLLVSLSPNAAPLPPNATRTHHTSPPPTSPINNNNNNTFDGFCDDSHKQSLESNRFERTSSLIKTFRHSCSKFGEQFHSLEIRFPHYTAVLDMLTPNSYVLIIVPDTEIYPAAIKINVRLARTKFEELQAGVAA